MSVFEDKIRRNKSYFDNYEPEKGHKDRFADKLNGLKSGRENSFHYRQFLRIAAVLIVLITSVTMIYQYYINTSDKSQRQMVETIKYSENLQNVMAYYDAISLQKVDEIDKFVKNHEKANKLKQTALNRLSDIDGSLASIEKELTKNPDDEYIKSALINTKRKKVEVMDDILQQLDFANSSLF